MLTRRSWVAGSALVSAGLWSGVSLGQGIPPARPLPIPQLLDVRANGGRISLTIAAGTHAYLPGMPVRSFGYSGPVLGPAIRLRRGETAEITFENKMDEVTTVHSHGVLIPGLQDGGPHNLIRPGERWTAKLHIDQPETTAWFHPHPPGATARQVYAGLAGLFLIEDGSAERLQLPRDYGVDDLPLVLQDRVFGKGGEPIYDAGGMGIMAGYRGNSFIVNGIVGPAARVPAGLVRLRIVNGANARFFDLGFSDSREFHVVASDGGYLTAPVPMRRLLVAPGERYQILVDFANGHDVVLATGPDRNLPMMGMMMGGNLPASGGDLMKFEVNTSRPGATKDVPRSLAEIPSHDLSKVASTRQFLLNDMMMGGGMMMGTRGMGPVMAINGRPFDAGRIDVAARIGTTELWHIGSQMMGHPFHVHGTQFQIVTLNGQIPPAHMRGWKDTVIVARQAEILVPFTQPAAQDAGLMFHCHILEHEDAGMMGQYTCA